MSLLLPYPSNGKVWWHKNLDKQFSKERLPIEKAKIESSNCELTREKKEVFDLIWFRDNNVYLVIDTAEDSIKSTLSQNRYTMKPVMGYESSFVENDSLNEISYEFIKTTVFCF